MQKPYPGPNVMLPAIDLSCSPNLDHNLAFKRKEAIWKQLISREHKKWCLCGSYLNHFKTVQEPLIDKTVSECTIDEEDTSGGEKGGGDEGEEDIFTEEDFIEGIDQP